MKKLAVVGIGIVMMSALNVWAGEKDDAIKLVDEAAAMVTKDAKAAITELNNAQGPFVKGELYVFMYDLSGTMIAHPKNAKLVGKNLLDTPDAEGKLFRKDIIQTAKTTGTGWVDYKYKNPESNKIEAKTTYVKKVGNYVLCAGIYKK